MNDRQLWLPFTLAACITFGDRGAAQARLVNQRIEARLGPRGLIEIRDRTGGGAHRLTSDEFMISLDGTVIRSRELSTPSRALAGRVVTYRWTAGKISLAVEYQLDPDWRCVSKRIAVAISPANRFTIDSVTVLDLTFARDPAEQFVIRTDRPKLELGAYGTAVRFADHSGLLAVVQNPFLEIDRSPNGLAIRYRPAMEWKSTYGPFTSDRGLLAPYRSAGERLPAEMTAEWVIEPNGSSLGLDRAEVDAFTDLVRAFLIYRPATPLNVFVGWCVNDYQIDAGTDAGRAQYARVIDRAAKLGAKYVLYAPSNSELSRREASVDDWGWEHVLWLGLGQRIRDNSWRIASDRIPESIQTMVDYASGKGVKLLAYVYPVLPFSQRDDWIVTRPDRPGRRYASLGARSLQDWLIESLVAFYRRTGIGGYAFDHTFLTFDGSSRYAQWYGWRRVMEELRRQVPEIQIDGRQAYHLYGPWSLLAGSYPHPTMNDEQPESFVPFPDLHFDRVSADRERYTAYRYRNFEFAPSEIVPGFVTHQTSRGADDGEMPAVKTDRGVMLQSFRARDWDYLGWRYSLLSSIAVGGWNNVLNMIPARDPEEDRHFAEADQVWFRRWLDWTTENREYLRHTRTILGQPAAGKIDGTSAIIDDRGFLFLFNPNARRLAASLVLDHSIGLVGSGPFLLRELYPSDGRNLGNPGVGWWSPGDTVRVELEGGSATVLRIEPRTAGAGTATLFGVVGGASLEGGTIRLTGVRGEVGATVPITVMVSGPADVKTVEVNGMPIRFTRSAGGITGQVIFAGAQFSHYQQLDRYDPTFGGGSVKGSFTIPGRIIGQLEARRRAWPIPWTPEDYRATWLAPERLLLFVQIFEPNDRMDVRLTIDGQTVALQRAYSAVRITPETFVGFYADISLLSPDRVHQFEVTLPKLKPGQYQGLFVENVETESTDRLAPPN